MEDHGDNPSPVVGAVRPEGPRHSHQLRPDRHDGLGAAQHHTQLTHSLICEEGGRTPLLLATKRKGVLITERLPLIDKTD